MHDYNVEVGESHATTRRLAHGDDGPSVVLQMGHVLGVEKGSSRPLGGEFLQNLDLEFVSEFLNDAFAGEGVDMDDFDEYEDKYEDAMDAFQFSLKHVPVFAKASLHQGILNSAVLSKFIGPERRVTKMTGTLSLLTRDSRFLLTYPGASLWCLLVGIGARKS